MLSKIQRTKVESKSQQLIEYLELLTSCYQKYKEQKLKANHNSISGERNSIWVVIKNTKNKSWKQITTRLYTSVCYEGCYQKYKEQKLKANHNVARIAAYYFMLLSKIQRTKVESKSQQMQLIAVLAPVVIKNTKNKSWKQITTQQVQDRFVVSCYQKYKEQKLKANHNVKQRFVQPIKVVIKNTKNKSWKQITTRRYRVKWQYSCYQKYKEQKLKANHNLCK